MDLDDEELKATRESNGADRRSVENLIEELTKVRPDELSTEGLKLFNKINEIINKNKELEEENSIQKSQLMSAFDRGFIHKSLIEEKILNSMKEEHDKAIEGFIKRDIPQCIEDGGIAQELGYFIGKIEELLEKR